MLGGVRTPAVLLLLATCATACTGEDSSGAGSAPAVGTKVSEGSGGCDMPELSADAVIEAPARGGQVAGLVFGDLPARAGEELKIVWRVTGRGELEVASRRPDGSRADLVFGPRRHESSSFDRPGDEWGTGFAFDVPGCWRIELRRADVRAEVPVQVVAG